MQEGQVVSKISGNYCGYVDFDGVRYFDIREVDAVYHKFKSAPSKETLPSDSTKRKDAIQLLMNNVEQAQIEKEAIEALQRLDRTNRTNVKKRRQNNGPKFEHIEK